MRRTRQVKEFEWSDLGLSKVQGAELSKHLTPIQAAMIIEVPQVRLGIWKGTIAGAWVRGLITAEEANHKVAEAPPAKVEAYQIVQRARVEAEAIIQTAQASAWDIRRSAELDLSLDFQEGKGLWRGVLDWDVHRAVRFRTPCRAGGTMHILHVDWFESTIEIHRLVDGSQWSFSVEEMWEFSPTCGLSEAVIEDIQNHLEHYSESGWEELEELGERLGDRALAACLLQFRARNALMRKDDVPTHQLELGF